MDTTYATIMLVVFLVITGLAIDVGYLYVSEEDLKSAAETAALTGAQAIKNRLLFQADDPQKREQAAGDPVQATARKAAIEVVSGKQTAAALMELANNNGNALTADNDVTVGFWNISSRTYTPGGTPVNAMQVRTRRTAESSSVGLGSLGSFLARITGTASLGQTPVATAALLPGTRSTIAICSDVTDNACAYPQICFIPERRMSHGPLDGNGGSNHYLFTSLLHPASITNTMSQLVCQEMPVQEVCGKPVYTAGGSNDEVLRDMKAMMYDPKVDRANKEYDRNGRLAGWWVVVPVVQCTGVKDSDLFEPRTVTKYSLVRISRICIGGRAGCSQSGNPADAPAAACGGGDSGLYIDRISSLGCDSRSRKFFPGLHPVLVD